MTVTFHNHADHEHNVAITEKGNESNHIRGEPLMTDEKYEVEFSDNGDGTFTVEETDTYGHAGDETESLTASFSISDPELKMRCDFHNAGTSDFGPMRGTIDVD